MLYLSLVPVSQMLSLQGLCARRLRVTVEPNWVGICIHLLIELEFFLFTYGNEMAAKKRKCIVFLMNIIDYFFINYWTTHTCFFFFRMIRIVLKTITYAPAISNYVYICMHLVRTLPKRTTRDAQLHTPTQLHFMCGCSSRAWYTENTGPLFVKTNLLLFVSTFLW